MLLWKGYEEKYNDLDSFQCLPKLLISSLLNEIFT